MVGVPIIGRPGDAVSERGSATGRRRLVRNSREIRYGKVGEALPEARPPTSSILTFIRAACAMHEHDLSVRQIGRELWVERAVNDIGSSELELRRRKVNDLIEIRAIVPGDDERSFSPKFRVIIVRTTRRVGAFHRPRLARHEPKNIRAVTESAKNAFLAR